MKNIDDNELILNQLLAKILGLYQILDPKKVKLRGRFNNVYKSIFVILMLYQSIMSLILCLCGVYYWTNNTVESMIYLLISINILFANYKIYIVVHYSEDIWNCLSVTQFNFTNYRHQHRHILDLWRNLSIWLTYIFTVLCFLMAIGMAIYPLAFSNTFTVMKNHDVSSSTYGQNVLNLYLLFLEETYNTCFNVFYIIEIFCNTVILICIVIFDTILITLCLALTCQFQIICSSFELVGHKSYHSSNSKYRYYIL